MEELIMQNPVMLTITVVGSILVGVLAYLWDKDKGLALVNAVMLIIVLVLGWIQVHHEASYQQQIELLKGRLTILEQRER